MRLLLSTCLSCLIAGAVSADPPAANDSSTPEPAVQMLGGYELPYSGSGSIVFDSEEDTWAIAFHAPEAWTCTEVGYAFDTHDRRVKIHVTGSQAICIKEMLDLHGKLDVQQEDDALFVTLQTEEAVYRFEFLIHGELPAYSLEVGTGVDPSGCDVTREDCPGGSCECHGKCEACCPSGYHPNCSCSGAGSCRCLKNKVEKMLLEAVSVETEQIAIP